MTRSSPACTLKLKWNGHVTPWSIIIHEQSTLGMCYVTLSHYWHWPEQMEILNWFQCSVVEKICLFWQKIWNQLCKVKMFYHRQTGVGGVGVQLCHVRKSSIQHLTISHTEERFTLGSVSHLQNSGQAFVPGLVLGEDVSAVWNHPRLSLGCSVQSYTSPTTQKTLHHHTALGPNKHLVWQKIWKFDLCDVKRWGSVQCWSFSVRTMKSNSIQFHLVQSGPVWWWEDEVLVWSVSWLSLLVQTLMNRNVQLYTSTAP